MTSHHGSHDLHMTSHHGSHDPHMTSHLGSHDPHMYRGAQYGGYVQSSKGSRTDPPTKSNIAVSHEAAAKGDIVQLVSTPTYQPNGFHRSCPQAHTVACSYSVVQVMESLAGTDERFWTFLVCDRSCLPSGSFTSLSISLSLSLSSVACSLLRR